MWYQVANASSKAVGSISLYVMGTSNNRLGTRNHGDTTIQWLWLRVTMPHRSCSANTIFNSMWHFNSIWTVFCRFIKHGRSFPEPLLTDCQYNLFLERMVYRSERPLRTVHLNELLITSVCNQKSESTATMPFYPRPRTFPRQKDENFFYNFDFTVKHLRWVIACLWYGEQNNW